MKDTIKFKGHFEMLGLDKDNNVVFEYKDNNMIMDIARSVMARLISGVNNTPLIDRFMLGTKGHIGDDLLNPRYPGQDDFLTTNDRLFSFNEGDCYDVTFDPRSDEYGTQKIGKGQILSKTEKVGEEQEGVIIDRNLISDNRSVAYTIEIPTEFANISNNNKPVAYTEAALFCQNEIFAMKTFPARIKDNTVKFIINWTIIF